ncbi:DUF397 domain-containing protein [Nonomuraea sp. NPDC050394]|uniref:DUF397 domain-containing protein n=1 Tax=Nonomuraea sp. NPDC050394 TaxID=3364363 RepID=UPI00379D8D11
MTWEKPRSCNGNSACVEVWRPPAGCAAGCADVEHGHGLVLIRDSTVPDGPVLTVTPGEFAAFADAVKTGQYDDLVTADVRTR